MKKILFLVLIIIVAASFIITSFAHSGRTDSAGGHYDHKNGGYHYHHGNSAHDHYDIDGDGDIDCPIEFYGFYRKIAITIFFALIITAVVSFPFWDGDFTIKKIFTLFIPIFIIVSILVWLVI